MDANDNSKKLYLDAQDGLYTEAGPMADGRIHITIQSLGGYSLVQ